MRAVLACFVVVLAGFAAALDAAEKQKAAANTMSGSPAAKGEGAWRPLFDGRTTAGWRGYKSQAVPAGWKVVDGVLVKDGKVKAADIVTKDQFGDFELEFDWKLAPGGNAGVFYRGTEEYDHIYWSAPEYQLLDDAAHKDGGNRLTSAGSAYALYPPPAGVVKPAGEWNASRIVAKGPHVEHWLNGKKVVEYELWSPDWEAKVKASKFVDWPNYGRAKTGYIAIQGDHEGELALRNIRIRELR
jgi:hypothetical protein